MGSFGDYTEDKVLELVVGKTAFSTPTCYVALSTADPTDDASGLAEPSGGSYARKSTAGGDWNSSSGGSISNANDITFVTATGSWGTITHFALYDAVSGGNMMAHGSLSVAKAFVSGDTAQFAGGTPGEIVVTLT